MTKSDFKTRVGMGFFSCKWINNKGEVSTIQRAILGQYLPGFVKPMEDWEKGSKFPGGEDIKNNFSDFCA